MISIIKQEENHLLVELNATEANLNNADTFKSEMIGLLDEYDKTLVLNLSKVGYVDSSFLGALVASLKHAIGLKKDILLVGLTKDIRELMMLIRLDKVFKIYNNYDEATGSSLNQ
jgi:anti-sigma B factor antagonist